MGRLFLFLAMAVASVSPRAQADVEIPFSLNAKGSYYPHKETLYKEGDQAVLSYCLGTEPVCNRDHSYAKIGAIPYALYAEIIYRARGVAPKTAQDPAAASALEAEVNAKGAELAQIAVDQKKAKLERNRLGEEMEREARFGTTEDIDEANAAFRAAQGVTLDLRKRMTALQERLVVLRREQGLLVSAKGFLASLEPDRKLTMEENDSRIPEIRLPQLLNFLALHLTLGANEVTYQEALENNKGGKVLCEGETMPLVDRAIGAEMAHPQFPLAALGALVAKNAELVDRIGGEGKNLDRLFWVRVQRSVPDASDDERADLVDYCSAKSGGCRHLKLLSRRVSQEARLFRMAGLCVHSFARQLLPKVSVEP